MNGSGNGVQACPTKVKDILSWPIPKSLTALQAFLGLTGFYRRFVQHYATIVSPLTDLLKATTLKWTTIAETTFNHLKNAMTNLPVLALPDFDLPFEVTTDAFVLSQQNHSVAFFSRKMCPCLCSSSAYVRELFALTEAIKKMV